MAKEEPTARSRLRRAVEKVTPPGLLLASGGVSTGRLPVQNKHRPLTRAIALGAVVLVLYAYALRLPFFWDDIPLLPWVAGHDWHDILLSTENGYYRPVPLAIYKLGIELVPLARGLRPTLMHAIPLVLLWLSALALASTEGQAGPLAALLLITYPLLNEAIAWVTALSHPLTIFFTLVALWAFQRADTEKHMRYIGFLALLLAPLSHENGSISAWLVMGYLLIQRTRSLLASPSLPWLIAAVILSTALVLGRALIPGVYTVSDLRGLHQLKENFFYFLQVLLYPFGPAIGYAVRKWGANDFAMLTATLIVVAAWALAVRKRHGRELLTALWWWAVAALPTALALGYGSLFVGARLSTFAAVGAATFWAALVESTAATVSRQKMRWLVRGALATAIVLPSLAYHHRVVTLYRLMDALYDQVIEAARAYPDRPLTFVNVPSSLTWTTRTFPLSTDNVVGIPDYYDSTRLFLIVNLGPRDVRAVTYGPIYQKTEPFWLSLGPWVEGNGIREAVLERETFLGRYDKVERRFVLLHAGSVSRRSSNEDRPLATFEGGTRLVEATLHPLGRQLYHLMLVWEAAGPLDATILIHVTDAEGRILAQADGDALSGLISPRIWQAGDRIVDRRTFRLPDDYHGDLAVRVGFYNAKGRLPAWVGGERAPDDAPFVVRETVP